MSPLVPIGLSIVLNTVVLGGGLFWFKRQVKRVAAERAVACRALFAIEPLPPPGAEVQVLVEEDDGGVSELEAVHWPHLGWTDAVSLLPLENVLGWRWHPFKERPRDPEDDPANWSRERVKVELAKLFSEPPR